MTDSDVETLRRRLPGYALTDCKTAAEIDRLVDSLARIPAPAPGSRTPTAV